MNLDKFTAFSMMVRHELNKDEQKHPKFCDAMIDRNVIYATQERYYKKQNSKSPYFAEEILQEELAEAMNAYQQGDKTHCLQELAQCGAVILRMMELVHNETEKKPNGSLSAQSAMSCSAF